MSEWTKERRCEQCGASFTLKDHGHPGAQAAADALEEGNQYSSEADYFAVRYCPTHHKGVVGEALADAFGQVRKARTAAKSVSAGKAVLGWVLLAIVLGLVYVAWRALR